MIGLNALSAASAVGVYLAVTPDTTTGSATLAGVLVIAVGAMWLDKKQADSDRKKQIDTLEIERKKREQELTRVLIDNGVVIALAQSSTKENHERIVAFLSEAVTSVRECTKVIQTCHDLNLLRSTAEAIHDRRQKRHDDRQEAGDVAAEIRRECADHLTQAQINAEFKQHGRPG